MKSIATYAKQFGLLQSSAPRAAPDATIGSLQPIEFPLQFSEAALDAIARRNEMVRGRFVDMVNKSNELIRLRNAFVEASEEVGAILRESETVNSSLVEREIMLQRETDAHGDLKARYKVMHEERDARHHELQVLATEVGRFEDLARGRESRINALEAELLADRGVSASLTAELEKDRSAGAQLREALLAAKNQIEQNDALVSNLQGEIVSLKANYSVAEFHLRATQSSLNDSQGDARAMRDFLADREQRAIDLERRLADAEFELNDRNQRIATGEAALQEQQLEQNMAKLLWLQQAEKRNDEFERLQADFNELHAHAEASDILLAQARLELQSRTDELRKSERRADDFEARQGMHDERIQGLAKELSAVNGKLADVEASRTRLANRAQALVRAMKDNKVELEAAEQRARLVEEKLVADAARFDEVASRLRTQIHELSEQNEKEKLARVVAAGALEAARSRPLAPRPELDLHALLVEVDRAEAKDEEDRMSAFAPAPFDREALSEAAPAAPQQTDAKPRPTPPSPVEKGRAGRRTAPSGVARLTGTGR